MRILFTIEYAGTYYAGFQSQKNAVAVQNVLESALNRVTSENNKLVASGRTDEGVHALGMTAHFDTAKSYPPEKFRLAVNAYLPPDIIVKDAVEVPDTFHARYSVTAKTYLYKCYIGKTPSPLRRCTHMQVLPPIDIGLMREAAVYFLGEHDFTSFCKAGSSAKTTVRTIYNIEIDEKEDEIWFRVRGNGFLYNMVRIIVGLLINIGKGKYPPSAVSGIIAEKNRLRTRTVAESQGLYLLNTEYNGDRQSD